MKGADWDALGRAVPELRQLHICLPRLPLLHHPGCEVFRMESACAAGTPVFSPASLAWPAAQIPGSARARGCSNWYLDKFEYIPEKTGLPGCVGCGRCSRVCLAEMDRWSLEVER